MTTTLPALHASFVEAIRNEVEKDQRFVALLAGGSYIHGGFDEHSDLDFVVVVEDESYSEVMATRHAFAERLGRLLSAFPGQHVGEPRLLICLYGPPLLHVDLKFVRLSDLTRMVERPAVVFARDPQQLDARLDAAEVEWPSSSPEWFEQRAWIWLHYGAAKLARGELFEAIAMLAFFRDQILGPMMHRRAGRPQRGVRRIETLGEPVIAQLTATHPTVDADSVREAYLACVALYLDLRADAPPATLTRDMPEAVTRYLGVNS